MRPTGPIPFIDPLLGAQVGEYRITGVIGEGGMGVVYRGVHPVIGKAVAIKVLKAELAHHHGLTERLVEEARAVNAIGHRNIIDIFGLGDLPDGRPYIVMEQLTGEPLDVLLRREGRLPEQRAIDLVLELCQPLEAAHRAGVVHRDLKPGNVFLCDSQDGPPFLKLLDFGLARRTSGLGGSTSQTNRAFIVGTPNYLAPEQAQGGDISYRTDVYALGVVLFEFLTGALPLKGNSPLEVAMAHVSQAPPLVTDLEPGVSAGLTEIVARMLAKKPEHRPSVEELRRLLAPNAPLRPPPSAPRPQASGRPHRELTVTMMRPAPAAAPRRGWLLAVGGLLLIIAGLGWALVAAPPGPSTPLGVTGVPALGVTGVDAGPSTALGVTGVPALGVSAGPSLGLTGVDAGPSTALGVTGVPALGVTGVPAPGVTGVPGPRSKPELKAPSTEQLLARIATLEKKLRASTPAGEEPDPSSLRLLGGYRLKAELAGTPAARVEVSRKLDAWQRTHP